MGKISKIIIAFFLCFSLTACGNALDSFKEKEITISQIKEKMKEKEDFVMIVERENCGFCESIQEYIEETKQEHPGVVLYKLDTTDFGFSTESKESKTLVSSTPEGKEFLAIAKYFFYTPTIYAFENGEIVEAAVGFSETYKEVSVGGLEEPIDFDTASAVDFWEFITR